ncbi:MAG: hypothetical protein Q9220_001535 [cf. Caloplaca sp. 1 TL-2023]
MGTVSSAAWCIFDYPRSKVQEIPTPCNQTCGSIANALEINLLTANQSRPYDYCQDPNFSFNAASCASCYSKVPNQQLIGNFLNTLQTACQSQPPPTGYLPISPSQVFSLTPPTSPTASTNTTSYPPASNEDGSGLSWNAKVAICISVPVAALLVFSLLCLLFYVHRHNRQRSRKRHLNKSSSHRSRRNHGPDKRKHPHTHRKTLSNDTTTSDNHTFINTFNRPFTYPSSIRSDKFNGSNNILDQTPYPAPLRTQRTTPSIHTTTSPSTTLAHGLSPRSRLPSHLTTTSPPPMPKSASSLSPPPLQISQNRKSLSPQPLQPHNNNNRHSLSPQPLQPHHRHSLSPPLNRPPPPPRGLVGWEQRGIQHARTKSMRESMRRSGESYGTATTTERVKVKMSVPRGANISEWKEETRTPTPVTEGSWEEKEEDEKDEEKHGDIV